MIYREISFMWFWCFNVWFGGGLGEGLVKDMLDYKSLFFLIFRCFFSFYYYEILC